jgi:multidrug efflux pump subunit AcrB
MNQQEDNDRTLGTPGIPAFSIRNAHFTIVIWLILSILGVLSMILLPKDLLPTAHLPAVQILSFYTGMPVHHVEQELTYPYERYTGQAVGVEHQESRSLVGVSIVKNFFNESIDLSNAIAQTGSQVMSVLRKLPPGTQPPLILPFDSTAAVPLVMVAVGGDKSESALQDFARYQTTNAVQGVAGAMAPTVMGGKLRQAMVYLDSNKLANLNLSPVQVLNHLTNMNTFIPAGDIKIGKLDYQITTNGLVGNLKEMDDFLLRAENGTPIRLKQVGYAEDGAAIQTNIVEINNKKQVYLPVYRQPGANSLKVVDDVRAAVQRLGQSAKGFVLDVVADQSIFIRKAIESITHEALIGGGFAALMVLFFLGSPRATLAVMLSLPLSILAAFACLKALGQSLNVMSLGGLALSVGVLVDNAIVVIEVIIQKRERGLSALHASIIGANEVAMPVLVSTISTLVVFFPVLFLNGVVRVLFSSLGIAVVTSMAASYFAAMTVIPLFTSRFLSSTESIPKILQLFQIGLNRMNDKYIQSLRWTVRHRRLILPSALIVLIGACFVFAPQIGSELFPKADSGNFGLAFRGPTGLRVEETNELSHQIQARLRKWILPQDLKMIISNVGVYYGYSAAFTENSGSQDGFLNVELTEDRQHTSQYYAKIVRENLKKEFPNMDFGIELGGLLASAMNGGLISPIDVQISNAEITSSLTVANALLPQIKNVRGAVDVRLQQRFDAPEIDLSLNREKIRDLGLNPDEVIKNIVSATSNSATYNQQVWIDPKSGVDYLFGVQFPEKNLTTIDDLLQIPITSPFQKRSVPLKWMTSVSIGKGPTELNHSDLQPVLDIFLDAQDRDIASVAHDIRDLIKKQPLTPGTKVDVRGEVSIMDSAVAKMAGGFILAALLVYLIMVAQFRSFLLPAIIMTTVPMGLTGVIILLALTGTYFSIQAAIGCIFVIGVAVSHGVLLIEYILECSHKNKNLDEAIFEGARARLRPILMTSLASILALLPMAFGLGQGSEANIPLGRAVIGGQILSTLLNFYLVPALFRMLYTKTKSSGHSIKVPTADVVK